MARDLRSSSRSAESLRELLERLPQPAQPRRIPAGVHDVTPATLVSLVRRGEAVVLSRELAERILAELQ